LAADKSVTTEQVTDAQGKVIQFWIVWSPVADLSTAGPTDRVYAIDPTFGTIQFGDGITGKVPPVGFNNIRATYQFGGGLPGNVTAGAITTLRTTIPLVDHVKNLVAAGGGSDTEGLTAALERGTQSVKNRGRAVTAEDYEWLAFSASRDVARVLVLPDFNGQGLPETNWVTVLVVPGAADPRPYPSFELRQVVENYLLARAPAVTIAAGHIQVAGPTYVNVDVAADLYPVSISLAPQLETAAVSKLQAFLHPLTGGPLGQGWDFGALPCLSDFYGLLGGILGVDHLENLSMRIYVADPPGSPTTIDQSHPFNGSLPHYVLIASGNHTITVKLSTSGSSS
jgi:predicted phage baseplate assembly protein